MPHLWLMSERQCSGRHWPRSGLNASPVLIETSLRQPNFIMRILGDRTRTSNQAMERTADRCALYFEMTSTLPLRATRVDSGVPILSLRPKVHVAPLPALSLPPQLILGLVRRMKFTVAA